MAVQTPPAPPPATSIILPPLLPTTTSLLALLVPLLAYIAYALHALLAAQRAHTSSLTAVTEALRALHDKPLPSAQPSAEAVEAAQVQARTTTAAVERVAALIETRWPLDPQHHHHHYSNNNGASDNNNNNNNGASVGRRGSAASAVSRRSHSHHYHQAEEDADLYRRKVEAMEGLRRLMEAQPAPLVEDKDLYRRRVEALEGLKRVLEMQPSVEGLRVVSGAPAVGGGVGGAGGNKKAVRDSRALGAALSVKSEGRALKKERSGETLGESLLDL